jgi:hypothetical protein
MPLLSLTLSGANGKPHDWTHVSTPFTEVQTLLNTTGLDTTNVQENGLVPADLRTNANIDAVRIKVRNATGGSLSAGTLIYFSGTYSDGTTNYPKVDKAVSHATASSNYFAQGLLVATTANGVDGTAAVFYELSGIDTSSTSVGDLIYLDTTAGGWTKTRPTGGQYIQVVGTVTVVHASTGRVAFAFGSVPEFLTGGSSGLGASVQTLTVQGASGAAADIYHIADAGEDNADKWKVSVADGGIRTWENYTSGSYVSKMTLNSSGAMQTSGSITSSGFIIGSASITEAELETIDGVTAGTVAASKAVVVDANKDIGTFRNLTIDGTFSDGNYTFDTSGNVSGLGTIASGAITSTGVVTGTGFTIGSAVISEAELEILDGATTTTTELNLIDGGTSRGTTSVASGDGLLINDAGTMRMTNVDTVSTYFASHNVGGTNIVTTGALNSGSITSGFGTIDTGSSTITTTGVITSGGFTIGSAVITEAELEILDGATVTTTELNLLDALDRGSILYGNASGVTTVLGQGGSGTVLTSDGTDISWASSTVGDITSVVAGTGLTGGATSGDATVNVIGGDGITANSDDVAITAAQTTVTSVVNAALALGRDADNQIKFATDDQIIFEVAGGDGVTFKASGEIEATTLDISGDADIDGTLEADAITLNGTALGSLYSPIAGGSGIVTTGALNSGSITSGFGTIDTGSSTITTTGVITGGGFTIGSAVIVESELEMIDGITAGTAAASKAVVLDGSKNIATIGTIGSGAITSGGVVTATGFTIGSAAITEAELEIIDGATVTTTELNLIDGDTARGTNTVGTGDGLLVNDGGTMRMTNVDTVSTYFAGHSVGGSNIATVGTVGTGTWQGTKVASAYLDDDTAHLGVVQTFTANKTFTGTVTVGVDGTGKDVKLFGDSPGAYMEWDESADQLRIMGASADATTSTGKLLLATSLNDINANDVIGKIDFQAPHEATGTDAIEVAASIQAIAQATFTEAVNATDLIFSTGSSGAASEKFRMTSDGELGIGGANYGSDGQVLTSAGAGAAAAWESVSAGVSLSGNTDDTIATVTGSNALQGEANLTFNSSNVLAVTGTLTTSGAATLASLVCTAGATFGGGYASTGVTIGSDGDIATSGNVGIGTDAPQGLLEIAGANVYAYFDATQHVFLQLDRGSTSYHSSIQFTTAGTTNWRIAQQGADNLLTIVDENAEAATVSFLQGGDVTINTGNLVIGTSGKGIDFAATADAGGMTSEVLDDYEEGTWTPTILFGGAASGVGYGAQTGYYTKIGNVVTISGLLGLSAKGSSTGGATVGGLPFTVNNNSGAYAGSAGYVNKVTFADVPLHITLINTATIGLEEVTNAGARTEITNSNFADDSEIFFNLTYRAA